MPAPPVPTDELQQFGYRQELRRTLGGFSAFAAGFSFVSILTTVFQLFGFGYSFGGPLFFWSWPAVLAGQLLVALVFAELAARFPLAGSVYQWAKQLARGFTGWLAGWMMLLGCVVALAAAAIALQIVLPSVWSGFQLVGGDPSVTSPTGATNAVLLGTLLIVFTTLVNAAGVRVMARINDIGVAAELVGVVVLIGGLALFAARGPQVVLRSVAVSDGTSAAGVGGVLASALMAAYVLYGFDTAASVAEETRDARRAAPRAVLRAVLVSGLGGLAVVLTALMAAPSLTDGQLAGHGLPYVITAVFGDTFGRIFLADVAIAVIVCTLTIQTGTIRLIYAMARDGALPMSARLSGVNPRTGTPLGPAVLSGALAIGLLGVNVGNPTLFSTITGTSVVIVYLAYLLVTAPLLVRRLRGNFPAQPGLFSLGRWAIPVNVAAVAYGVVMIVNIAWPRAEIYDLAGSGSPWLLLFPVEFVAAALLIGGLCWLRLRRTAAPALEPAV
ncbi:amino acid permease [Amycolatopsis sp. FDAARGOS 1241]|uniref:amino acid permease n=1 Tax=Amycolatopsis sp. FDAARGOS 1241 TaxID=2778070 RepID=UPI0019517361|nr:amino acid permease [Amycolatopsis sp. FDAARGOS 1241]QRP50053.1 amino acid permease [Amycolatopsis sp. FDAARGOS 1241]